MIISSSQKGISALLEMISQNNFNEVVTVQGAGEARRLLIDRNFDLCIVNSPLCDEFGDKLACEITEKFTSQVFIVVRSELFEDIMEKVEDFGVFTLSKPLSRVMFRSALNLANASYNRMAMLENENHNLLNKLNELKIVNRAKYILIECFNMSENEAHRYIEKQAMDLRTSRKAIAESILRTYEN